jgi:hypothetical protein
MVACVPVISRELKAESKALETLCGYSSSSTTVVLMADKAGEGGGEVQGSAAAAGVIAVEFARMVSPVWKNSSGSHVQNGMSSSKVKEIRVNVECCSVVAHRTCERAPRRDELVFKEIIIKDITKGSA